jgi:predicted ester cyclase
MKRSFIACCVVVCFLAISCNSNEKGETKTNDQTENWNAKNKAVYKAIETGDVSGLDSVLSKDIVDHDMGGMKGADTVKKMLGDIHNHFDNLKMDVISMANDGDYLFTLVNFSGTAKDNYMGFEAGKPVSMKSVDVVRIKDGKATEHWGFTDNAEMMKMQKPSSNNMMDNNKMDTSKDKMGNK